jgi:hypothetical protein
MRLFSPDSVTVLTAIELLGRHRRMVEPERYGNRKWCRWCLVTWPCPVVLRANAVCTAAGIRLSELMDEARTRELPHYRRGGRSDWFGAAQ